MRQHRNLKPSTLFRVWYHHHPRLRCRADSRSVETALWTRNISRFTNVDRFSQDSFVHLGIFLSVCAPLRVQFQTFHLGAWCSACGFACNFPCYLTHENHDHDNSNDDNNGESETSAPTTDVAPTVPTVVKQRTTQCRWRFGVRRVRRIQWRWYRCNNAVSQLFGSACAAFAASLSATRA